MKKIVNVLLVSTFFCNYKCKFCFIGDKLNNVTTQWDDAKIKEIFQDFDVIWPDIMYDIRITGWEPLINDAFIQRILTYIQEHDLKEKIQNVTIVTNWVYLKKLLSLEKQIEYLGSKFILDVSFHAFEEKYEYLVQRKWVWKEVLWNIEAFSKKYTVMVNIVISNYNLSEIPELIIFLIKKGIVHFNFLYVSFAGYANENKKELFINYFENNEKIQRLYKLFLYLNGKKVWENFLNLTFTINFPNCQLNILWKNKKRIKNNSFDFIYNISPKYYFKSYNNFDQKDFLQIQKTYKNNHIGWYHEYKKDISAPEEENKVCYKCTEYTECNLYGDKINFLLDKILYENNLNVYSHYFEK